MAMVSSPGDIDTQKLLNKVNDILATDEKRKRYHDA